MGVGSVSIFSKMIYVIDLTVIFLEVGEVNFLGQIKKLS